MTAEQVFGYIGSYGFPIAACVYMATYFRKTIEKNTEVTQKLNLLIEAFLNQLKK